MTTKLLQLFAFLALIIVALGVLITPNSSMFWLASDSGFYQFMRLAVAAVLLIQLMTQPPRQVRFRLAAAALGLFTALWAAQQFYNDLMQPLDLLAFLGAALTIVETSLERRPEESLQLLLMCRLWTLPKSAR